MKKVVLALAVVFSVALVSCSSKEAAKADTDSVMTEEKVDSVAEDTVKADSVAVETPAEEVKADSAK